MRTTLLQAILVALAIPGIQTTVLNHTTSEAGNPFVDGWYADPDTEIYDGLYWVFPTSSYGYHEQTYLDAFSSPNLINWTKHPNVLTNASVTWANGAIWAPAPINRNGKYYLYFGANDIQEGDNTTIGGIGVGMADHPAGPYLDAIGAPLIGQYHNGAQPIDQDVFVDDDGQGYIYYGGHSHANVALLNEDMTSIGTFPDGTQYKEITPPNYVEGIQMVKRNGTYYLMWSEGVWTGPDYAVSYAMSDSPLGPFDSRKAKFLQQDPAVATGSGHNGVFNVPGTDIWYIVYHRRPLGDDNGDHRQLAYDRMSFEEDGSIADATMLVEDDFADGNAIGWVIYEGDWSVTEGRHFRGSASSGGKALLNTNFTSLVCDADVTITGGDPDGHAGVVFRTSAPGNGTDDYDGYYAGIKISGEVVVGRINGSWKELGSTKMNISANTRYHIRVRAVGSDIDVFVEDMETAKITVTDATYSEGQDGVRVYAADALFDNFSVAHP